MTLHSATPRPPAPHKPSSRTARGLGFTAIVAAVVMGASALAAAPATAEVASTPGIFADDLRPAVAADSDRDAVELGVSFSPQKSGAVTALQYYQGKRASGVMSATLWSSKGTALARVSFPASTAEGWRTISLPTPIAVTAGEKYVASYYAPNGRYPVTENDLTGTRTQNGFRLDSGAGVYTYGKSAFPRQSYRGSNYLVDVVFRAAETSPAKPTPTPTATATPTPTPKPTTTPTPKPTTTPTPSPTVKPTPLPTPPPKPTPTPTPTPTPAPAPTTPPATTSGVGWTVSPLTVGLAPQGLSCDALPLYTGSAEVPRGTVISGMRVTTPLDLSAGAITIDKSCIQPTSVGRGMPILHTQNYNTFNITPDTVTIRNSEISGIKLSTESAAWATGFMGIANLSGNYFHHMGSGIAIMKSGNTLNGLVERNYVTDLIAWGNAATTGNHTDAFTVRDFSASQRADRQLIIRNNRFNTDSGNDTGALFIQSYSGRIDNVVIEGNYLEGAGYQLGLNELNSPYSNLRALNNRFSGTGFGATYAQRGPGWAQWENNYIYDKNATDGKGRLVGKPWPSA